MQFLCQKIVQARLFQPFILGVIVVASIVVGLETFPRLMEKYGSAFRLFDITVLTIFVIEILIKVGAHGRRPWRFFRDPWNVFDFTIVSLAFLPATGPFAPVLRLARVLRVLRLISVVPRLQVIVTALLRSIPSMGFIGLLLMLHFYVYAVVGTFLFAQNDPMHFGSLHASFLSLFRTVTLEDWTDLMYIQMYGSDSYPIFGFEGEAPEPRAFPLLSPLYFVSFILFGTMIVLNLFIGVVVNSLHEVQVEAELEKRQRNLEKTGRPSLEDDILALEHRLEETHKLLQLLRHRAVNETEPRPRG